MGEEEVRGQVKDLVDGYKGSQGPSSQLGNSPDSTHA